MSPAGYSGTPLDRKLGLSAGMRVLIDNAPANYEALVGPVFVALDRASRAGPSVALAHVFRDRRSELARTLAALRKALPDDATVWVSWPKKSSRRPTDVTEDIVRELALPLGYVDVKVCAVDGTWSGLKLVVRKTLRSH